MNLQFLKQLKKIIPAVSMNRLNKEISVVVLANNLLFTLMCLKKHLSYQYNLLTAISGVDFLKRSYRFCLVYELLSITFNSRIKVKIFLDEFTEVLSSTSIFINADWWEREVWDMFGIYFKNHPDLRRILTDYGFEGHPLKKNFPLQGYSEIRYDLKKKCLYFQAVEFSQNFRNFDYETPW